MNKMILKIIFCLAVILILPAIGFCFVPGAEIIIDNSDAAGYSETGAWSSGTSASGYYGSNYRTAALSGSPAQAEWKTNLPLSGRYSVSIYRPASDTFCSGAVYKIIHKKGTMTKKLDQRFFGGKWLSLGVFDFDTSGAKVLLISEGSNSGGLLAADAVKFQRYYDLPQITFESVTFPESVELNTEFSVIFNIRTNLPQTGLRACYVFEMRNAANDATLTTHFMDGVKKGYKDTQIISTDKCMVTDPSVKSVYFVMYLFPFGINDWVIREFETTPVDGTFPYKWEGNGVTHDIKYMGQVVLSNNSGNYCYCSGITFESFMDAWEAYNLKFSGTNIWGLTVAQIKTFRSRWYGALSNRGCSTDAITYHNAGTQITDLDEVQRGDFVQIWRGPTSGHSVIFLDFERNADGSIDKLVYWSTQTSTNGCGYNKESWANLTSETSFARAAKPHDSDDWENRFADYSTKSTPVFIGNPNLIIVDNTDPGCSATSGWISSAASAEHYGADYLFTENGDGTDTCVWDLELPKKGQWKISEYHNSHETRTPDAKYQITGTYGRADIAVDQRINGGGWHYLGTFTFAAGSGKVELTNQCSPQYIIADAIKAEWVSDVVITPSYIAEFILKKRAPSAEEEVNYDLNQDGSINICDLIRSLSR